LRNELSVFAFLILSTAVIVFILYWALIAKNSRRENDFILRNFALDPLPQK
jgi:hypothetical protein